MMTIVVVCVIFTIVVAILSVMTLTEGYGFKHTIDPPVDQDDQAEKANSHDKQENSF